MGRSAVTYGVGAGTTSQILNFLAVDQCLLGEEL